MFPGKAKAVVYYADTGARMGGKCAIDERMLREMRELLGEKNVIVKLSLIHISFEEETGIKVNYLTFDSNESMYTKLKTGGTTFDVIIPSDYMIAKLISEDMLEPLDFANIPNYEYIDEAFRDQAYDCLLYTSRCV